MSASADDPSFMSQIASGLGNAMYSPLMGIAAGLLQAGGPSRMPTSLGQAIGAGLLGGQQFSSAGLQQALQRQGLMRGQNQLNFMGQMARYLGQVQPGQQMSPTDLQNMSILAGSAGLPTQAYTSAAGQRLQYAPDVTLTPAQAATQVPGGLPPGVAMQMNTATGKLTPVTTNPVAKVNGYDAAGYPISTLIDTRTGQLLNPQNTPSTTSGAGAPLPMPVGAGSSPPNLAPRPSPPQNSNIPVLTSSAQRAQQQNQTVDLIGQYRLQPSAYMMRTPAGVALMAKVQQKYPDYDAKNYATAQSTLNDFSTGTAAKQVKSFNVALQHLDTLDQLSQALANNDTRSINALKNTIKNQMGVAAPASFDAAKQLVADEIQKAVAGVPGGEGEREELMSNISAASSPQQLHGVINTFEHLMAGQLNGLQQQYVSGTNRQDFQTKYLTPQSRALFNRYMPSPQTAAAPPSQKQQSQPVNNAQGASALPPAARAALKEGQYVKFANGQVWALINGQPQRIQ